jgi:hypothetical protein
MAFIVKRDPIVIPAGIPVASTNTINVVDEEDVGQTISLTKFSSTEYRTSSYSFNYGTVYCPSSDTDEIAAVYRIVVIKENGYWIYRYVSLYYCYETNQDYNFDIASVQEVTSGIIPTTGWITITAA